MVYTQENKQSVETVLEGAWTEQCKDYEVNYFKYVQRANRNDIYRTKV
jgi:hypothetical protein